MIASLRRIGKLEIVKVFSLTAISTIVKMVTGFISVKIVSGLIGPGGIALLGQFNNFSAIFLTISTGGINIGVTKYVAEYSTSENKVKQLLKCAFWITSAMSLMSGLVLVIGSQYFSKLILHDVKYSSVITIFGFTIVFYSFNSLLLSIINGYKEFKKFVAINIISSVVGLFFTLSLVFYFGVYGALLAGVTFESVILIVTIFVIVKSRIIKLNGFFEKLSPTIFLKLARYSLMALVSVATVPISQLLVRSSIVHNYSLSDAGLWEGMDKLSAMYLLVITSSLGVYYLPRLSEIKTDVELRKEIINTYKVVLPPLLVIVTVIFFSRDFIIKIVFNDKFQGMQNLFAFQLIGDFFKICSWILAYQMIARSMTKFYILSEIFGSVMFVVLAVSLIQLYGNVGASLGYAITYLVYFIAMLIIFRKLIFAHAK